MINKIIILLFISAPLLSAQNLPPPEYSYSDSLEIEINVEPTIKECPASKILLGTFPIYFEETTLQQIMDTLKVGQITQQGDAAADIYWLCYTDPNPSSPQRLWIISNAEMAGAQHRVTEVVIQSINKKLISIQGNPMLPRSFRFAALDKGVHIGITKKKLINILGQPSGSRKEWLRYCYEGKLRNETRESRDGSSLFVKVIDGKIAALYAWRSTIK